MYQHPLPHLTWIINPDFNWNRVGSVRRLNLVYLAFKRKVYLVQHDTFTNVLCGVKDDFYIAYDHGPPHFDAEVNQQNSHSKDQY